MKVIVVCILFALVALSGYSKTYQKGEIVEINGIKGIVFSCDENGHGLIMGIDAYRGDKKIWCNESKYYNKTSAFSLDDGRQNTVSIYDFVEENNLTLDIFPLFKWCRSLGEGWFIPSVEEIKQFVDFWQGIDNELNWDDDKEESSEIVLEDDNHALMINEKIIYAGGVPFDNYIYTSTESENHKVYTFYFNKQKKWWKFYKFKKGTYPSWMTGRAFYHF